MDPAFYPSPEFFDGFRFEKIRQDNPQNAGKAMYAASNHQSMAFG